MKKRPIIITVALLAAVGGWAAWRWWPRPQPAPSFALNARTDVRYVGDTTCSVCHHDIAEQYRQHPMGHSLAPVGDDDTPANATFTAHGLQLSTERRDGKMIQSERLLDAAGKRVVESSAEVSFVCGSGEQGKSYLIDRGGFLFFSPITWYRSGGWKLSPGYEQGTLHFDRPVTFACLNCHSNRPLHVAGSENKYREPIFEGHTIGCERCHGPGELHVARQAHHEHDDGVDNTIVNPARLTPSLRDSVCEQCHLQGEGRIVRRGKALDDYRPGLPLSDFLAIYVRPPELTQGRRAINHVEQMEVSRCREGSGGKLGCISCHDPHSLPARKERVAFYRDRCQQCHADNGCRLPEHERMTKNDNSCVDCHMPKAESANIAHLAVTDHRIVRRPGYNPPTPERLRPSGDMPLIHFHGHLPGAKGDDEKRNLGLMIAEMATRPGTEAVKKMIASRAEPMLREAASDDVDALEALGAVLSLEGRQAEAIEVFDRALKLAPERASLLEAAAFAEPTPERWKRYLAVAPLRPRGHFHLAEALAAQTNWPAVTAACRESLRLDPTHVPARRLLAKALRETGDTAAAQREEAIIEKLERVK
jgi:tetratricopeptide (TPR) repeat protein